MPARSSSYILILAVLSLLLLIWGCATTSSGSKEANARMELANSHLQNNRPRRSYQELKELQDQAQDVPQYHFLLGMTYLRLEGIDNQRAIEELKKAVELDPEMGMAWNNLGMAYFQSGRPTKAEEAFREALSISSYLTPEYASYNLSRLYSEQGRLDKALEYAQKSLKQNWRYLPAYDLITDLYIEQGRMEKAGEYLQQGVEAFPDNGRLWLRYGKAQLRLGENKQAAQSLQRVLEVAPDSESAQAARDYLDLLEP